MDLEEEIAKFPSFCITEKQFYSIYEKWSSLLKKASKHPNRNALMTMLFEKMGMNYPERVFDRLLSLQEKEDGLFEGAQTELYRSEFTRSQILTSDKVYLKIGAGRTLREITCYEIACHMGLERFLPLIKVSVFHDLELHRIHREFVWCKVPEDFYDENSLLNLLPNQKYLSRLITYHYGPGTKFRRAVGQIQEEIPNVLQNNFTENPIMQMMEFSKRIRLQDFFPLVCLSIVICGGDQAIRDTSNSNIVFEQKEDGNVLVPHCIDFEDPPPTFTDRAESNIFLYPAAFCTGLTALPIINEEIPWEIIESVGHEILQNTQDIEKYAKAYTSKVIELFPREDYSHEVEQLGEMDYSQNTFPEMTIQQFEKDGRFFQMLYADQHVKSLKERIRRLRSFFEELAPKKRSENVSLSCFDLIDYIFPDYAQDWKMLERRGYTPFQSGRLIGSLQMDYCILLGKMRVADMKKGLY